MVCIYGILQLYNFRNLWFSRNRTYEISLEWHVQYTRNLQKIFFVMQFFDYFNQIFTDEIGFLIIAWVINFLQRILFCTFWYLQGLSKWCLNHFCVGLLIRWWWWMTILFRMSIVQFNLFRKECDSRALNDRKYALYKRNGYRPKPRE